MSCLKFFEKEYNTITLYFSAPKDLFENTDEEAEGIEISVECPREYVSSSYASVEYSPIIYDEKKNEYIYYDWREIDLPYEEIEALIKLAEETERL